MRRRYGLEELRFRRRLFVVRIVLVFFLVSIVGIASLYSYRYVHNNVLNYDSTARLYQSWEKHDFEGYSDVYEYSTEILKVKRFSNIALTFKGYSAFMLAESSTDNGVSKRYLDEAIYCLRCALQNATPKTQGQIEYMLARSYFYKNKLSSYHYYSDLVVKYILLAEEHNFISDDMSIMLGLTYASLGETEKSIASFTEALLVRENDTLLFNIAKQYFLNKQGSVAKQYLGRVINLSQDEELLNSSHILLAQIFFDEENYPEAEKEYRFILEKNADNAEAYFGLGNIYEKQGERIKARAEWRKCLRIQPNHSGALQKIS